MFKSWWFNLILGLLIGLALGYVLAENQPVPPAKALVKGMESSGGAAGMPQNHPPVQADQPQSSQVDAQAAELERALKSKPGDPDLLTALGNLYFDARRWDEARGAYEGVVRARPDDPNVLTDLAVTYRNMGQPEKAFGLLNRALAAKPDHWQALFNKVVVLQFDLHRNDDARKALTDLEKIKQANPEVPDLSRLKQEIEGTH